MSNPTPPSRPPAPLEKAFQVAEEARPPRRRGKRALRVGPASEIPPGEKRIIEDGRLSIGVFNVDGTFYAIRNICPHQGAPLCRGSVHATHRPSAVGRFDPALPGRVIRCPWHAWEFDIATGQALFDPNLRIATYVTEITPGGDLVVWV